VKGHVHDAQAVARERLGMLFAASLVLYLLSKLRPKSDSFPQLPTRTGLARRLLEPLAKLFPISTQTCFLVLRQKLLIHALQSQIHGCRGLI
jgi:hypothetical protein